MEIPMTESEVKKLMATFGAAFRAGDADAAAACLADDFTWQLPAGNGDPRGQVLQGLDATLRYLRDRFAEQQDGGDGVAFSDGRMEVFGDMVILRYRVRGTAEGGQPVDAMGLDVFRVANGRILSKDAYWKQVTWPVSSH
ncbi:nuclear transport factor 2 family protein [Cupriavidus necator]|uniref:Nuclear transport factor 2 family protein n=2 Tax=Cupriavidus necator TaxID=106590 RepID=A0A367PIL0_CUPNE|nr:nuclear transport factor 2 family protein [Cupriavidus necator]